MKRDLWLFRAACALFAVSAFSMALSFFADRRGNSTQVAVAVWIGILFWAGLIGGAACIFVVNKDRKAQEEKMKKRRAKKGRAGALKFFSNRKATVADAAMVLSFVLMLSLGFIPEAGNTLAMIFLPFFLFAVYMHCVLNGVNYQYINSIKKESKK